LLPAVRDSWKAVGPIPFATEATRAALRFPSAQLDFDVFFVHRDLVAALSEGGIAGLTFAAVIDHRIGNELSGLVELRFPAVIACAETSRLPAVTCRPDNEESTVKGFAGPSRISQTTPHCGRVKYHAPTRLAVLAGTCKDAPDVFQTAEWFGSGAEAHRLTLCSQRSVELVRERGWRGLKFSAVRDEGYSERAAFLPGKI
jgi:hypothetical protein